MARELFLQTTSVGIQASFRIDSILADQSTFHQSELVPDSTSMTYVFFPPETQHNCKFLQPLEPPL